MARTVLVSFVKVRILADLEETFLIMGSALEAAPERSAAALAERPLKWRVGVRLTPPSRRELKLVAAETHPLVATRSTKSSDGATTAALAAAIAQSAREQSAVDKLDALMTTSMEDHELEKPLKELTRMLPTNKAELIVLQDGDVDPLGVLSLGDPQLKPGDGNIEKPASAASATRQATASAAKASASFSMAETMPQTVKDRWTAHKDRVLAKYATYTFKIKAVRLISKPEDVVPIVALSCCCCVEYA